MFEREYPIDDKLVYQDLPDFSQRFVDSLHRVLSKAKEAGSAVAVPNCKSEDIKPGLKTYTLEAGHGQVFGEAASQSTEIQSN